jgi:hypothetical protein
MPAVQLLRLKSEITALVLLFDQPAAFERGLADLLEYYSNRVYRAGRSVASSSHFQSYHIPPLVLNQLEAEFSRLARQNRASALAIIDRQGNETYFENRYLAYAMLGQITLEPAEDILDRVTAWLKPHLDPNLQEIIFSKATQGLRRQRHLGWLEVIESWCEDTRPAYKAIGLRALRSLVEDEQFENLPFVFKLIREPLLAPTPLLLPILLQILKSLIVQVPVETAFFLKQMVTTVQLSARSARLIRKTIPYFPAQAQKPLKEAMKNISHSQTTE